MKIGYLYDLQIFPPKGGNHVHALELVNGFLEAGHQVAVVGDPTVEGVQNFQEIEAELDTFIAEIDVLYVRIDARDTRDWKALNYCAARIGKKPVVWEINAPANETLAYSYLGGMTSWRMEDEPLLRRIKRRFHALRKYPAIWAEERHRKQLAKRVSTAICVSKTLGDYAATGLGFSDVVVLPNGGPLLSREEIEKRRSKRTDTRFTVMYSGSAIYPWQGLNFLTSTIDIATKTDPDIRFVLAVNQRVDTLPKTDNVVIKEGLSRDEILDEICQADLCVALHPHYYWSPWGFHNSPMKMFEYMGCGSAVLASNLGQMKDLLTHGKDGLLCENNPEAILEQIRIAKANADLLKQISQNGWEKVATEMSWKDNVRVTLDKFSDLIAKG